MPRGTPLLIAVFAALGLAGTGGLLLLEKGDPIKSPDRDKPPPPAEAKPLEPLPQKMRNLTDKDVVEFLYRGPGSLWAMLMLVMGAVWLGAIGQILGRLCRGREFNPLRNGWRPGLGDYLMGLGWGILVVILVAVPFLLDEIFQDRDQKSSLKVPVFGYGGKLQVLGVFAAAATVSFLVRLWWVKGLANWFLDGDGPEPNRPSESPDSGGRSPAARPTPTLPDLQRLADELRACLLGLGTMLTLVVLSTAALRTALARFHGAEVVPLEAVLAYGLYYSFVLAVIYVPAHLRMHELARHAVARWYPEGAQPDPTKPPVPPTHEILKHRDDTLRLLGLGGDWADAVRSGALVFSPLLATVIAQVLPTK